MPAPAPLLALAETQLLAELGERLRRARLRRRLSATDVAEEASITRATLHRAESGHSAVTMGTYLKIMAALGISADLALLGRDDYVGRRLQDERLPQRRTRRAAASEVEPPKRISVRAYPQLKQIAWHLADDADLEPAEALSLYERNWRHVDVAAMTAAERELVQSLTDTVGKGVLLV